MPTLLNALLSSILRSTGYGILKPGDLDRLLAERAASARSRQDYVVSHHCPKGRPSTELVRVRARELPTRTGTARRLLDAYSLAHKEESVAGVSQKNNDLWTELVRNELGDLLDILDKDDEEALAAYLMHFGEKHTWFGGLTFSMDDYGFSENRLESRVALAYLDKLVCLAEALGVLPVELPEHGRWGENIYSDPALLVSAIENQLGIEITPPSGAIFVAGIQAGKGVYHYRHINAAYTAHLISSLIPIGGRVAEYGGGLGAVALYAGRLGYRDYTLFDLPITNLFAGHFLINSLGADSVSLFGEQQRNDSIKILPYWKCASIHSGHFDLSLNQDSFPEIDVDLVNYFLREIQRTTRGFLLSINHEAQSSMTDTKRQLNVSALLAQTPGYRRISRCRYWLREGYVQEVYQLLE